VEANTKLTIKQSRKRMSTSKRPEPRRRASRGKIFLGLIIAAIVIFAAYFATRRISPNAAAILRTTQRTSRW